MVSAAHVRSVVGGWLFAVGVTVRGVFLLGALCFAVVLLAVLLGLLGYTPAHAPSFTDLQLPTI
jgi:hypothetical protein